MLDICNSKGKLITDNLPRPTKQAGKKEHWGEKTKRPWGTYEVLLDDTNCKVKKISIEPGQSPSYQYHHKRSEDWIVIEGKGRVRLDLEEFEIGPGDRVHIPALSRHAIQNIDSDKNLVFIEIQTGTYFGEDDIVRLEDRYGRA